MNTLKYLISLIKNNAFITFIILLLLVVPISYYVIVYDNLTKFSSFFIGLLKGIIGVFVFWIIDKCAIKEVDTIDELKKGNIAYAIFLFALAIIIASAMLIA